MWLLDSRWRDLKIKRASEVSVLLSMKHLLLLFCLHGAALAQQLSNGQPVPAGDPTLIAADGGYYLFSSGIGAPILHSADLFTWEKAGRVMAEMPAWAAAHVPKHQNYVWAPDIVKIGGEYRCYWSTSTIGSQQSVIGFASTPSLNPAQWTDRGQVISTTPEDDWNAIDPQCFQDQEGRVWLLAGSYWTGIKMHRLDEAMGKLSAEDTKLHHLARRTDLQPAALEGAYLIWHAGYYVLFVSFDFCHLGVKSNYNIRAGRSREVTGPYVDRAGRTMLDSGGTLLFESQGDIRGPGHNSILQHDGRTWTAFHYFNDPKKKHSRVLQIREITWDSEGWPVIGDVVKP